MGDNRHELSWTKDKSYIKWKNIYWDTNKK